MWRSGSSWLVRSEDEGETSEAERMRGGGGEVYGGGNRKRTVDGRRWWRRRRRSESGGGGEVQDGGVTCIRCCVCVMLTESSCRSLLFLSPPNMAGPALFSASFSHHFYGDIYFLLW
ncbi:hypothetical protein Dsin_006067 [Dipteronia sinensis]|uniref:Uncharacterized protein n=1 Tax=Dipteronia sinensis TaxID=43782 RepID=A0AAE0AYH5_9ROSI|nr:hypothetical protein Dsin_006067 [Dipteronia sinensis]